MVESPTMIGFAETVWHWCPKFYAEPRRCGEDYSSFSGDRARRRLEQPYICESKYGSVSMMTKNVNFHVSLVEVVCRTSRRPNPVTAHGIDYDP